MILEPGPRILITGEEIQKAVCRLAREITRDYYDKNPYLISILKGSFIFAADLIRHLEFPLELEFVRLSSYGRKRESSGNVIALDLSLNVENRDVLVIDDIVDTGRTLSFLLETLKNSTPKSLKLCALADKPGRRQIPVTIDYLGFTLPDKFIVGYGIDWDEKYRYLPDICTLE